jgi:alkanesulfonate monooxygenase SsuD/methylene tetrahydromethanopterin reductase-like flavin-dependent oxidoreductase (luciferase family)
MRLGVFSILDAYPSRDPRRAATRPESTLGLVRAAELLGYDAFWVGEHHFRPTGTLPAPPIWLAAAARETSRIRLGSLVSVLPLHDPRELAEQYALVDRLSGGRLDIGLGSGYDPLEFSAAGVGYEDRRDRFEAALPVFRRALAGEPFPLASDHRSSVALNVRPLQRPHPPIWVAAARPAAIERIAELGYGLALIPYATLGRFEELGQHVALYRRYLRAGVEPRVLVCMHVYAGTRLGHARRALQRFLDSRPSPDSPAYHDRLRRHPDLQRARGLERTGLVWFDTGPGLASRIAATEAAGVTDFAGIFDFGDLDWPEVGRSLRGFQSAVRSPVPVAPPEVGRALLSGGELAAVEGSIP